VCTAHRSENISGGSNSYSRAYGVVVDKEGNIYVTGFFEDDGRSWGPV
jgi:hypothetical protein